MRMLSLYVGLAICTSTPLVAQELAVLNETRVVASGQRSQVWFHYSLQPDCTPTGPITIRILKQPANGKLEHEAGRWFPFFKPDNVRNHCNTKQADGFLFFYTSNGGFTGQDQTEIEAITSTGSSRKVRLRINVK